jgi:Ca2+-binding RTX toxin-like protein
MSNESHTGIIGACDPSWCSFDAGTGLVECDAAAFCGSNNGALGIISDRIVSTVGYNWIATIECLNLTTSSCTIDDALGEVDGFRMRGTDVGETLLYSFCSAGFQTCPNNCSCTTPIITVSPSHGTLITLEVNGADGPDEIVGGNSHTSIDTLRGNGGADQIAGLFGVDWIYAGANPAGAFFRDLVYGGPGDDHLYGNAGDDDLAGGDGDDYVDGGDGDDKKLEGGDGNDIIVGGSGEDVLTGYGGNDVLIGGDNHDALQGGADNDILCEDGTDGDRLEGDSPLTGDDVLWYDPAGGVPPEARSSGEAGFDTCSTVFTPLANWMCEAFVLTKPVECP